jgi:hypothetical protein
LDPFSGSATTLVEAQRLGRRSIGVDVNPISCLIADAKTLQVSAAQIGREIEGLELRLARDWESIVPANLPDTVQPDKWYTTSTLSSLLKLWAVIEADQSDARPLFQAAFSSILLSACRETRHWGYICDNTTPKSSREANALDLFRSALSKFARAYKARDDYWSKAIPDAQVYCGDASKCLGELPSNHCSLLVTSPPYQGVADYVKAQRLSMEWFAFEIEPFRKSEIGARSKRHRKQSSAAYLKELENVFAESYRVLRPGALGVIIFGQSPARADCEKEFVERLHHVGFSVELERKRLIPAGRRLPPSVLDETVLVVRK